MSTSDVIRSGARLEHALSGRLLHRSHINRPVVVLVHGFTSHGRYLDDLARYADQEGLLPALFNYDSYTGIDAASSLLRERLDAAFLGDSPHTYSLIGHSMGGLVALDFASTAPLPDRLKSIALLGTPTGGAPNRAAIYNPGNWRPAAKIVSYMLDWADLLTGPNPYNRQPNCPSALQLTGQDGLEFLNSLWARVPALKTPILSVSGGLKFLDLGKIVNRLANAQLQAIIKETRNDGLIGETSSDAARNLDCGQVTHLNEYREYTQINHTYLTANQNIIDMVMRWTAERMRARVAQS